MKKHLTHFRALIIAIMMSFSSLQTTQIFGYSFSDSKIIVELDDNILNLSKNPIIKDGTTLVPLREIADAMNISITWDNKTKTIGCIKDDIYLTFVVDSNVMKSSEDTPVIIEVPPTLIDGTTYVPLRAISHAFNCEVYWDSNLQTVFIYSPANTEDAVLESKLSKLSMYIYAINNEMCLDKGSYMSLAKVLKPEYEDYQEEFDDFSRIFSDDDPPFGKININYSNINSCEMKKAKKALNLSADSIDVLIDETKKFADSIDCKIPDFANYYSDIILYEKYIENYTVKEIDESLDKPYIFKQKYASAEKEYNRHIKQMDKFKQEYLSADSDKLIPDGDKLFDAEQDLKDILEDVKTIYINLGIASKVNNNSPKTDIKPLIKADLELTAYLRDFISKASDLKADTNGKTLKKRYADFQSRYNALYIKTLETYSHLFKVNKTNPDFSVAFDTIIKMNYSQISDCTYTIKQLLAEWQYFAARLNLKIY